MSDSETTTTATTVAATVAATHLRHDDPHSASTNGPESPSKRAKTDTVPHHTRPVTDPPPLPPPLLPPQAAAIPALPKASLVSPPSGSSTGPSTLSPKKTTYTQPYDVPGMRMSVSAVLADNARDMWHRGTPPAGYPARRPSKPAAATDISSSNGGSSSSSSSNNNTTTTATAEPGTIPPWGKAPPPPSESANNLTSEQLVRALTSVPPKTTASSKSPDNAAGPGTEKKQQKSPPLTESHHQVALGNALAAVAASVSNRDSATSTATAIGSLAAKFTNILQATTTASSTNEDGTLAAAAAAGRRASSGIPNQNTLTQMLDQAIRLGAQQQPSSQATTTEQQQQQLAKKNKPEKRKRTIRSDKVWNDLAGFQEKLLGTHLYRPGVLFPVNAAQLNGLVHVLVPASYLTYHNPQVKKRALWGTDIYTDDSDVVAMIVHCGKYTMPFVEPDIAPNDPLFLALGVEPDSTTSKNNLRYHVRKPSSPTTTASPAMIPDHDLKVTLRVMPALERYTGTIQNYIASRTWGSNHDGVSYHVECVEKIQRGRAQPCGRHGIKANMTQYAYDRYVTVGLPTTATRLHGQDDSDDAMEEITPAMLWKPKTKKKKATVVSPPSTAEATHPSPSSPETTTPTPPTTGRRRAVRRAAYKGKNNKNRA